MARPIAKTPILAGIDAKNFREALVVSLMPRWSETEIEGKKRELRQMKNYYQTVVSASNGVFF